MRKSVTLVFVVCALLLSSCTGPTYFSHPISPPSDADYDVGILGVWIARHDDGLYQLAIKPMETSNVRRFIEISATATHLIQNGDGDGQSQFSWFKRIAHVTELNGTKYYNIRAPSVDSGGTVLLTDSGLRPPKSDETKFWTAWDFEPREYWIAKVEISDDGKLWLSFVIVPPLEYLGNGHSELANPRMKRFLEHHDTEISIWSESCGEYCSYYRVQIPSHLMEELMSLVPEEVLYVFGPLVHLKSAVPKADYGPRGE